MEPLINVSGRPLAIVRGIEPTGSERIDPRSALTAELMSRGPLALMLRPPDARVLEAIDEALGNLDEVPIHVDKARGAVTDTLGEAGRANETVTAAAALLDQARQAFAETVALLVRARELVADNADALNLAHEVEAPPSTL